MLRIYIIGLCILLIAIIANVIVGKLGVSTWYDFGPQFFKRGLIVFKEVGFLNSLWLFILYPLVLALGYILGDKIYALFWDSILVLLGDKFLLIFAILFWLNNYLFFVDCQRINDNLYF